MPDSPRNLHPLWATMQKPNIADVERVAIMGVIILSTQFPYSHMTPEGVFDALIERSTEILSGERSIMSGRYSEDFLRKILRRIDDFEERSSSQLKEVLSKMSTQADALSRVQADVKAVSSKMDTLATQVKGVSDGVDSESDTITQLVQEIRNQAGSGNADALNAVADQLEGVGTRLDGHVSTLQAAAAKAQQGALAGTTLQIIPPTFSIAAGATQQFTTNLPSTFSAANGSVDANGVYTAPTDPAITSDQVTATSTADPTKTATASGSIVAVAAPTTAAPTA